MRLIGMLDSPYVRRVAISLDVLGVPFTHEAVSVFSTVNEFKAINPVVKAPTLVCADGEVLMDSSLILQFIEATATDGESLWSHDPQSLQHEVRAVGLALAACEKTVQILYESKLRPASAQYEPWMTRIRYQLLAAYDGLELLVQQCPEVFSDPDTQAVITAAVAWQFTQSVLADVVQAEQHPCLSRLSELMELTPAFVKYPPVGPGV